MSQHRKHRGYKNQQLVAEHLRDIYPHAESTGAGRPGADVTGTPGLAIEVKARKGLNLAADMRQAALNAGRMLPVLITRLNGQGPKSIGEWPVILRFDDFKDLWKAANQQQGDTRGFDQE